MHISTTYLYPTGLGRPATEDDPADSSGTIGGDYARTKALGEQALLATRDATILRLAFVYGEGAPHLEDVAQAVLKTLDSGAGGIFNIADDSPTTAVELHLLNGLTPGEEAVQQDFDPWHGITSPLRAQRELGFRPRYPSAWAAAVAGTL